MKPLFSSKGSYNANIKLTDKDEIIQKDGKIAETLNSFFENAVSSLKLNENSFVINNEHKYIQDPIEKIIVKYQFHRSILIIKNKIENTNTFRFKHVILSDIKNELKVSIQVKQQHITIFLQRFYSKVLKSLQTLCSYSLITQY